MINLSKEEIFSYNTGLDQEKWNITKAMMAMDFKDILTPEVKRLLKFIHDEIEKEKK